MPNFLLTMWDTLNSSNIGILVAAGLGMFAVIGGLAMLSYHYTLGSIKSRTVGDGQHGTARWATEQEIRSSYALVPFRVADWRAGICRKRKAWCWAAATEEKAASRRWWTAMTSTVS